MDLFKELGDMFGNMYTKQHQLAAIHLLGVSVVTSEGKTSRLAADQLVRIEDGKLVDCGEGKPATHKIQMCMGTLANTNFELLLTELETHEPLNIKI